jgi:hypothetical protein
MNQKISIQELIALNNTPKAKALVVKYGYKPARSYNDLIKKLIILTREHREDALKELVEIHPHKELILNYSIQNPIIEEVKSNCNGDTICSKCMQKQQFSNFEGELSPNKLDLSKNTELNNDWKSMLPIIGVTSLVTASLVILITRGK